MFVYGTLLQQHKANSTAACGSFLSSSRCFLRSVTQVQVAKRHVVIPTCSINLKSTTNAGSSFSCGFDCLHRRLGLFVGQPPSLPATNKKKRFKISDLQEPRPKVRESEAQSRVGILQLKCSKSFCAPSAFLILQSQNGLALNRIKQTQVLFSL